MRKLGDLQLKSSAGQKVRSLISKQIDQWEKNLEAYHVDLFRNKCYLCALTNDRELPNPKDLLAQACPTTKAALHKLAAFTPCSFYACIASRRRSERSSLKCRLEKKILPNDQQAKQETKCYLTLPNSPLTSTVAEQTILQMVTCESNPQMVRWFPLELHLTIDSYSFSGRSSRSVERGRSANSSNVSRRNYVFKAMITFSISTRRHPMASSRNRRQNSTSW